MYKSVAVTKATTDNRLITYWKSDIFHVWWALLALKALNFGSFPNSIRIPNNRLSTCMCRYVLLHCRTTLIKVEVGVITVNVRLGKCVSTKGQIYSNMWTNKCQFGTCKYLQFSICY